MNCTCTIKKSGLDPYCPTCHPCAPRPRPVPLPTLVEAAHAALALMQRECDIRPETDEQMLAVMRDLESALAREARP